MTKYEIEPKKKGIKFINSKKKDYLKNMLYMGK